MHSRTGVAPEVRPGLAPPHLVVRAANWRPSSISSVLRRSWSERESASPSAWAKVPVDECSGVAGQMGHFVAIPGFAFIVI